jgi:hypothetical protein
MPAQAPVCAGTSKRMPDKIPAPVLIFFIRLAEEKWKSRLNKTTKENYLEMGLVSITVVGYTRKNGQFVVDM